MYPFFFLLSCSCLLGKDRFQGGVIDGRYSLSDPFIPRLPFGIIISNRPECMSHDTESRHGLTVILQRTASVLDKEFHIMSNAGNHFCIDNFIRKKSNVGRRSYVVVHVKESNNEWTNEQTNERTNEQTRKERWEEMSFHRLRTTHPSIERP